ncbi:Membrane protein involved in the export of O-antigen and teichoic acid [Pustulibacterium marinum]|uniref:Membrane protein involved in the export of O-antigen and teichoic acid n=1 Tax=Pustulibacterium marinum TaxID=1224947 RepID=A0A1I7GEC6_9FLAO|nr:oligosaccharide flippase family protein [Pustulibacterium marinum]SFU46616.1 Membrane protein involved in the export of O-antigen and teichoic acid [Pustulibacterium marinum]
MIAKLLHIIKEKNFASLIANVSVAALGLLSFMLLARQLDKTFFGEWILFITLASFVDLLRFGMTSTSTVRLLSGASKDRVKVLLGSSYKINLILWLIITVVCYLLFFVLSYFVNDLSSGYMLFLKWYPVLALLNLSWNNACTLFQAEQNFLRMMLVKLSNIGLFSLFLLLNYLFFNLGSNYIIAAFLTTNFIASAWVILKKWDGLRFLKYQDKATVKELINFGKYSMGTLVGSSLLKSADTFIIGLSPIMGSAAIAMYAIPLKLTDVLGIPLRSLTMTAYPKMSKKMLNNDINGARKTFYAYSGAITIIFLPIALVCFLLAKDLILFLGGESYAAYIDELVIVFRIFTAYTILLPVDRFAGVMLDSANKPQLNMIKVIIMTIANIVMNCIAVFYFESLILVAVGTVVFTLIGIGLSFIYLKRELQIHSRYIIPESIHFFKNINSFFPR